MRDYLSALIVAGVTLLAGIVSFLSKMVHGKVMKYPFAEFCLDIGSAALAGIVTFLGCKAMGISEAWSGAITGIAAHMGARALLLYEYELTKRFRRNTPPTPNP